MLCAHSIINTCTCTRHSLLCVLLTLILPSLLPSRPRSPTLCSRVCVKYVCVVVSPRSKCRRELSDYFLSSPLPSPPFLLTNLPVLPSQRISVLPLTHPSPLSAPPRRKIPICVCLTLERPAIPRSNAAPPETRRNAIKSETESRALE